MSRWRQVFQTQQPYKAELAKGLLEEEGIPAMVFNRQDHAYLMGTLEVLVPDDHYLRALHFINEKLILE